MSWHDDLTRNFSRWFSRTKSVERNESEDETSEQHLNVTLQESDIQDKISESDVKDIRRGGAGGSLPPLLPLNESPSGSAAPPSDGLLKRLGSLFLLGQTESVEVQKERETNTEEIKSSSIREREQSLEPSRSLQHAEPSHFTTEISECHSEVTQSESEDQSNGVDINSEKEKRCYDLVCPPVVTYGTYRGVRDVRKQKKKKKKDYIEPCLSVSDGDNQKLKEINVSSVSSGVREHINDVNTLSHNTSIIQQINTDIYESGSQCEQTSVKTNSDEQSSVNKSTLDLFDPHMSLNEEKDLSSYKDVLRVESIKMMDNIQVNTFAAVQRIKESDAESELLTTEPVLFDGEDPSSSLILEETLTSGPGHSSDGFRSTPSSGYESIAGSDTDIRCCTGVAYYDITSTNVPVCSEHEENVSVPDHFTQEEEERNKMSIIRDNNENLNIIQHTDINLGVPVLSKQLTVHGSKTEKDERVQDTERENNCGHHLNDNSFHVCLIETDISVNQTSEPLNNNQKHHDMRDGTKTSNRKLQSENTEQKQICYDSDVERFLPSKTEERAESPWTSVKAFCCTVTNDLIPETFEEDLNFESSPADKKIHLDFSSRLIPRHQQFELVHADEGFDVVGEEEEETDVVFVNDTGFVNSPGIRRTKTYPFSLSPIYEEESVREDSSRQETLQVPPATEEEHGSEDLSILSLLQSVSEKLQSSMLLDTDSRSDTEDTEKDSSDLLLNQQLRDSKSDNDLNLKDPHDEHQDGKNEKSKGLEKLISRPSLIFIYEGQTFSGERREINHDVEDAETILFPHTTTIHALKGCWLLYGDCRYGGSCVLLEEDRSVCIRREEEFTHSDKSDLTYIDSVGSIRTLMTDEGFPEIRLHNRTAPCKEPITLFSATDLTELHGTVLLQDLHVITGCWLVYEESGFSGNSAVLERDGRVSSILKSSLVSRVKSLRPLKMGGLKVMRPHDPKVILYEEVKFQGKSKELMDHNPHVMKTEGLVRISSIQVMGGIWVCFSEEGFRGHQCVLEEGQYSNCTELFRQTKSEIRSLYYIQSDFLEPSVHLKNFNDETSLVDVDVPDLKINQSENINVIRGVWVAYSHEEFSGEQYVLEKGRHPGSLEWSFGRSPPRSLRPVHREVCSTSEPKFLLRAYTRSHYSGDVIEITGDVTDCTDILSLRVIRGSWLLFDEKGYYGNQYVLNEGLYPDLVSCGCASTSVRSLKPIPYSFTDPSVSLFSLSDFEGLEITSHSDMENMDHFFSQSLRVNSGIWVAYEYGGFNGRQMLLESGEYSDWGKHCNWDTIGSLKSLKQPKVYIQVRNRGLGSVLTTEKIQEGSFPAKVFLSSANYLLRTQRWIFTDDGLLKNTMQKGCLSVIGSKARVGARVALWEEHGRVNQRWSVNVDGTISSHLNRSLVLDLKSGNASEHLILNQICTNKVTQIWDFNVL